MKEVNEDFRDIFTYSNFRKTMVENQEMREENHEIKEQNMEMRREIGAVKKFMKRVEESERYSEQRVKND